MIINPSLKNCTKQEKTFRLKCKLEEEIEQVESHTYLQIKVDNKLLWKPQIKQFSKNYLEHVM